MRTTTCSVLTNKLQVLSGTRVQQRPAAVVPDACAVLWTMPRPTFQTSSLLQQLPLRDISGMTSTLHVVFDNYHRLSAKSWCRTARQKGSRPVNSLIEGAPLPKQTLVLYVAANKERVIQIIVDHMSALQPPPDKRSMVTGPDPRPVHMCWPSEQSHRP